MSVRGVALSLMFCFLSPVLLADELDMMIDFIEKTESVDSGEAYSWDRALDANAFAGVMENCYERDVNPRAKEALLDFLEKNGAEKQRSVSMEDKKLLFYCAHALHIASSKGVKISSVAYDGTLVANNNAALIGKCYHVMDAGFGPKLRGIIKAGVWRVRACEGKRALRQI